MEKILTFFTETLSGTTYIIVVIIAVILFFACIGFLAERSIMRKKKMEQYAKANTNVKTPPVKEPVTPQAQVQPSIAQPQNVTASPSSAPQMRVGAPTSTVVQSSVVPPQPVGQVKPVVNPVPPVQNTPVTPTTNASVIPEITPSRSNTDQSDIL